MKNIRKKYYDQGGYFSNKNPPKPPKNPVRPPPNHEPQIYINPNNPNDYIYVDDVCRALKLCLDTAPVNQIINIGSGKPYKFLDIIETALEKANSTSRIINIEPTTFHNIVQTKHSYLDTAKLRSYGFKLKFTMEQIVERLVEYYRNTE